MNHDEHDQLWKLLGKAREPKASPFFANKVMHAIRREAQAPEKKPSLFVWLRRWWIIPTAAGACAALALSTFLKDPVAPQPTPEFAKADPLSEMVVAVTENDDLDISLSDLLANEEQSVWLAADPSSIF